MADRPLAAYDGDASYLFVSYSHEDDDLVYAEIRSRFQSYASTNEGGIRLSLALVRPKPADCLPNLYRRYAD